MKYIIGALGLVGAVILAFMVPVPCAVCGVNMTVAEVTQRPYDNVAGNFHRDCAYMAYCEAAEQRTWLKTEITKSKTKLINKHAGTSTDFP